MKLFHKFLSIASLLAILTMTATTTALAFDGRTGEDVVIEANEVVNDDLYVSAANFTLDGTVKGDVYVSGGIITINGTIEGDLVAAGQAIIINGTVADDVRMAGAALQLGSDASVGGDLLGASASLETQAGSTVKGDLLYAGAQALLDGDVAKDVMVGSAALELGGKFGGDVRAEVADPDENNSSPSMYMGDTGISVPNVKPGLTINKSASIDGDLTYTQSKDIDIPAGVVAGKITRNEPVVDVQTQYVAPTPAQLAMTWVANLVRDIVTLLLLGLLVGWLFPSFVKALMDKVQSAPAASLGWGLVGYAVFVFAIPLILVVVIMLAILFGVISLGGLSGTILWLGILLLFASVVGFVLFTVYLTKIIVAWLGGKWLISRFNPALADHKLWPLLVGVILLSILLAVPVAGWLAGVFVTFIGLGALWIWSSEMRQSQKTA